MGNKISTPNKNAEPEISPEEKMVQQRLKMLANSNNQIPQNYNDNANQFNQNSATNNNIIQPNQNQSNTQIINNQMIPDITDNQPIPKETSKKDVIMQDIINEPNERNSLKKEPLKGLITKEHSSENIQINQEKSSENNALSRENSLNIKQEIDIDLEHVTIEKIFKISLTNDNKHKFIYLEDYVAGLISEEKPLAYRIADLDTVLISIINHPDKQNGILKYFLESYHRAYEMIEKRFKSKYDEKYQVIRRFLASYANMICNAPENFGIVLSKEEIIKDITKYHNETETDELENFYSDIVKYSEGEVDYIKNYFNYVFDIINLQNFSSTPNLFNCEKLKKNLRFLTKLINENPILAEAYCENNKFNPKNSPNGKFFQMNSSFSLFFSINTLDCDPNLVKNQISIRSMPEAEASGKALLTKLNLYLNDLFEFVRVLVKSSETSKNLTLSWLSSLINLNLERNKMYVNPYVVSTIGFILNVLDDKNIFFGINLTKEVADIDYFYSITTNTINFSKFDRINHDDVKDLIEKKLILSNEDNFSLNTKLYFIIHCLLNYVLKNFEDEYTKILQQLQTYISSGLFADPKFKDLVCLMKACDCYIRNNDLMKPLLKFNQATIIQLLAFNNKKYSINYLKNNKISEKIFFEEFYENMSFDESLELSILPVCVVKNLAIGLSLIRKYYPDILLNEFNLTKTFAYFSLIYSSHNALLKNPHLRSELFDIIYYFITIHPHEIQKTPNIVNLTKILSDNFVKNNIVYTLMVLFNDAERLGTSNQFYEKFNVRSKILHLFLDNILKKDKIAYSAKLAEFANNYPDESTKMINLVIGDLTYLNDECIEKLEQIKKYQDLIGDVEKFKNLDPEVKSHELEKFNNNDRIAKSEVRIFNLSMEFMVVVSKNCTQNFFNLKLAEKLSNLLNFSLDVFTTKRGMKLKIKNMKDYEFDPKFILINVVRIYNSFYLFDEFYEFIAKDERSFKIENFEKVLTIQRKGKISITYEEIKIFEKFVEKIKETDKEIKSKKVSYDDAPDHFLDQITADIMEDPVKLPSSGTIVDRNTIEKHLHSDPNDPFNRSKLTKDMLIPMPELKKEIEDYKKSKQINK